MINRIKTMGKTGRPSIKEIIYIFFWGGGLSKYRITHINSNTIILLMIFKLFRSNLKWERWLSRWLAYFFAKGTGALSSTSRFQHLHVHYTVNRIQNQKKKKKVLRYQTDLCSSFHCSDCCLYVLSDPENFMYKFLKITSSY